MLPDVHIHLFVVNDGSATGIADQDIELLQKQLSNFTYLPYSPNRGKGYALRTGVANSANDICIYTDIDFPYQAESFVAIYHTLASGKADVAVGIKSEDYYKNVPPMRIRISKFLRYLIRLLLRISITDTQCGLKGFNQKGKAIFSKTTIDRYLFDLEFIYLSDRKNSGVTMKPVTVHLKEGVQFSTMNPKILLTEGINFLKILVR